MKLKQEFTESRDSYYHRILVILNGFLKLSDLELRVLAEIMLLNYENRMVDKESRGLIIFSKNNRYRIVERTGSSYQSLNNILSKFRKLGYIVGDRLSDKLDIGMGEQAEITFKIKLDE
jgi:hypothetical protein